MPTFPSFLPQFSLIIPTKQQSHPLLPTTGLAFSAPALGLQAQDPQPRGSRLCKAVLSQLAVIAAEGADG